MTADSGTPGASARRRAEELRLAGSRRAEEWERGATGEQQVGRIIDAAAGVAALHDRALPGRAANIDHLVIAPSGVYVIDAKAYTGHPRIETIADGRRRELWVGDEDRTALIDAVRWQARVVGAILAEPVIPVRAVLCFVGVTWETRNGYLVDDVGITSDIRLAELLASPGPLTTQRIRDLHTRLAASLTAM